MSRQAENEFLNIKQAAAFLNVSEVSLRRWTNAGTLACLRVGAKRERRFRREDLIAFMAQEGATRQPRTVAPAPAGAVLEGIRIDPGNHLCTVYRDDRGQVKLAVPFLNDGLAAGQACFLVGSTAAEAHILERLRDVRPTLDADIRAGRLVILESSASPEDLCEDMADQFVKALHGGATALRMLGDTSWFIERGLPSESLIAHEARYERQLAKRFPVVTLCQYDAREFDGTGILAALEHHPDTFNHPTARFLG